MMCGMVVTETEKSIRKIPQVSGPDNDVQSPKTISVRKQNKKENRGNLPMNEKNYDLFRKGLWNCLIFSAIYVICMYRNPSAITFPVFMGAGIWLLYGLRFWKNKSAAQSGMLYGKAHDVCRQEMETDAPIGENAVSKQPQIPAVWEAPVSKKSLLPVVLLSVLALGVPFTDNGVMVGITKCLCVILFFLLAVELFIPYENWTDLRFVQSEAYLLGNSLIGFIPLLADLIDSSEVKRKRKESGEFAEDKKETKKKLVLPAGTKYVVKGLLVAAGLLCIIVPVMASADVVFKNFLNRTFNIDWLLRIFDIDLIVEMFNNVPGIMLSFTFAMCAGYGLIRKVVLKPEGVLVGQKEKKYGNILTGITVLSVIAFVYLVFGGFQIFGIVNSNVALPQGYTYARYAREGFFQLFALALINLFIVLVSLSRFEKNRVVRALLYVMCGCTYVMVFASAYKMCLYISVYNLTFLRLMVLWALGVITFLMVLVILYIGKENFSLFKSGLCLVTICFTLAVFLRPDYQIANYNINYGNQENVDYYYLCHQLSMDAYPVIMRAYARKEALQAGSADALNGYYKALDQGTIEGYQDCLADTLREKYDRQRGFSLRRLNLSREYVAGELAAKLTNEDLEEENMARAWNGE